MHMYAAHVVGSTVSQQLSSSVLRMEVLLGGTYMLTYKHASNAADEWSHGSQQAGAVQGRIGWRYHGMHACMMGHVQQVRWDPWQQRIGVCGWQHNR